MEPLFPWVGARRVAIVPVTNAQVDPSPPADFQYQVRNRLFYDPDPATGVDRSFQNYLHTLSYGQAFIEGEVFPPVVSPDAEINRAAMNALPSGHGYKHVVAVLPHAFGNHRSGIAFWNASPINGVDAWARLALFNDQLLSQRQPIGVWGMEILHMMVHFGDLYNVTPNLGNYDVMAGASASPHASSHTKAAMGWLPQGRFISHTSGTTAASLQAISLPQPPPSGRATAVRIKSRLGSHMFVVEARLRTDQYEQINAAGDGIPMEGVIVYEVVDRLQVFLRAVLTPGPGATYTNVAEGLTVHLDAAIAGGYSVTVSSEASDRCPALLAQIEAWDETLAEETDQSRKRQIRAKIAQLTKQAHILGCL